MLKLSNKDAGTAPRTHQGGSTQRANSWAWLIEYNPRKVATILSQYNTLFLCRELVLDIYIADGGEESCQSEAVHASLPFYCIWAFPTQQSTFPKRRNFLSLIQSKPYSKCVTKLSRFIALGTISVFFLIELPCCRPCKNTGGYLPDITMPNTCEQKGKDCDKLGARCCRGPRVEGCSCPDGTYFDGKKCVNQTAKCDRPCIGISVSVPPASRLVQSRSSFRCVELDSRKFHTATTITTLRSLGHFDAILFLFHTMSDMMKHLF